MTNLQKSLLENVALDVVADSDLDRGGLNVVVVVTAYALGYCQGLETSQIVLCRNCLNLHCDGVPDIRRLKEILERKYW